MFENEGTEIEQSQQSDVSQEVSSEPQIESQPVQQEAQPKVEKEVPFHEHPRWKEVMDERNSERERAKALELRLQQMEKQYQDSLKPKSEDPMYERLKGIDPEFADYMKGLKSRAEKAEALEARLEQFEQQQFTNSAKTAFNQLNTKNGISPELSSIYEQQLEAAYARGEFKDIQGLEKAYEKIHTNFSKLLEARERQALEKYTATKKQDAKAPVTQPKGRAPTQNGKVDYSKDPHEARAQLIKNMASAMKSSRGDA